MRSTLSAMILMVLLAVFSWLRGLDSQAGTVEPLEDSPGIAFFKPPQGVDQPIRLPLEQYAESDWFHLTFSEYRGPRVRLAVLVEDHLPNLLEGSISESGIAERLATALEGTHRFDVVTLERAASAEAPAGFWPPTRGQYLIRATPAPPGKDEVIRMTFRIIDALGGQVIFSSTESAKVRSRAVDSSLLKALDVCINKGTYRLALWLAQRPWAGSVVEVERGRVVIDAGSRHGLTPKMQLRALVHQEVIDPESGQLLGATTRGSGILELVAVQEQRAVARVVEGCEELATGDRVELLQ